MDEPVAHDRRKGDLSHHPQVTPEGVSHEDVVEVQPLFCLIEVSGGIRHQDLRQCSGSALTKLIRSLKSLIVQTGDRARDVDGEFVLECLSLVDQLHVVRKICWNMVPKGRHVVAATSICEAA